MIYSDGTQEEMLIKAREAISKGEKYFFGLQLDENGRPEYVAVFSLDGVVFFKEDV
jgi:hypothetical protein